MKRKNRHITIEAKIIIGIIICIMVFFGSLYLMHNNFFKLLASANKAVALIVGTFVFLLFLGSFIFGLSLIGILVSIIIFDYHSKKSYLKSKEQIKVLPNDFVNVKIKHFNNILLSHVVASEDITCFAKLDENGKVIYKIQINAEYKTNDYETFLEDFEV